MRCLAALLALAASVAAVEPQTYNPVASSASIVLASDKNVRVTVLSPCLVRVEYSATAGSGQFEDRATLAFINRNTNTPTFQQGESNGVLSVKTSCIDLEYKVGSPSLDAGLTISSAAGLSPAFQWTPALGLTSPTNLLGTIRSLDEIETVDLNCTNNANITVHDESLHCVWSPFSVDGWHVIDDFNTTILDANDWVSNDTSASSTDLYFFGHGLNFKQALKDYVTVSGNHPLLPKFAMGVMWSRWYDLSFHDVRYLVEDGYGAHGIPLDLFVLDMDWHAKYGPNATGQEWTGWTFDRRLFPQPDDYWAWLRYMKLAAALNIHDADGVAPDESRYAEFATAVGADPSSNQTIPAWFDDEAYMNAVEDILLKPFQDGSGHRYANWRDWQQGGSTGVRTRNLNPTIWLNHASVTDPYRRGENWRGWTLARYGGIGNQRYPTGFSGDVRHAWDSLAFQVYFTTTAASVVYQWSNDIVAQSGDNPGEQEMHTRWVQWGSHSPHFRTHDAGGAVGGCADKGGCEVIELWNAPKGLVDANRWALAERQSLTPTWYTLNRLAYTDGLTPVRPMYMLAPADSTAYAQIVRNQQYTIGDDIIVSPVTAPSDVAELTTNWTYWLPQGEWYDDITGRLWNTSFMPSGAGGVAGNFSSAYDIREIPRSFRGGSVVARIPYDESDTIAVARRDYTHLIFDVYPGGPGTGMTTVYEDDGETLNYTRGAFATTTASYSTAQASAAHGPGAASSAHPLATTATTTVTISTDGSYATLPASRAYSVRLVMSFPPTAVTVGGVAVPYARFGCTAGSRDPTKIATCWSYDGNTLTTTVTAAAQTTADGSKIVITAPGWAQPSASPLNGVKGAVTRAQIAKRVVFDPDVRPGDMKSLFFDLQTLSTTGDALSYAAQPAPAGSSSTFMNLVLGVPQLWQSAVDQVASVSPSKVNSTRITRGTVLLETAMSGYLQALEADL